MKKWSQYKTASGAIKAKFTSRSGYLFSTLPTDASRLSYLATIFPNMSQPQREKLLAALRVKWDGALTLQQLWANKHVKRT